MIDDWRNAAPGWLNQQRTNPILSAAHTVIEHFTQRENHSYAAQGLVAGKYLPQHTPDYSRWLGIKKSTLPKKLIKMTQI